MKSAIISKNGKIGYIRTIWIRRWSKFNKLSTKHEMTFSWSFVFDTRTAVTAGSWLKDRMNASFTHFRTQTFQRGFDRRGVMSEIVIHGHASEIAFVLKATFCVDEVSQ